MFWVPPTVKQTKSLVSSMHACSHKDTQVPMAETNWMLLIITRYHAIYNLFRRWRHLLYFAQCSDTDYTQAHSIYSSPEWLLTCLTTFFIVSPLTWNCIRGLSIYWYVCPSVGLFIGLWWSNWKVAKRLLLLPATRSRVAVYPETERDKQSGSAMLKTGTDWCDLQWLSE